jgi:GDPmannose 4,6-dehydratase
MTTTSKCAPSRRRRALITGVAGQDGCYLSKLLLSKEYDVVGTSRDAAATRRDGLAALGIEQRVKVVSMSSTDFRSVLRVVAQHEPDEIYHLAGQTSVGLSFEQPVEAIESIALGVLNLLEAVRFYGRPVKLYNAGSSECFGDTGAAPADETTPFRPRSPYAVAKVCAHNLVANYREAYGLFACTGVLFNHESPLRPERFVTQKIVRTASRIARGSPERLSLGKLDIHRDWGWAPEYVDAMWRMLDADEPCDFVIATGRSVSLEQFVRTTFDHFALDWRRFVDHDPALLRPSDIRYGMASPALALQRLGWQASMNVDGVIRAMCDAAAAAPAAAHAAR